MAEVIKMPKMSDTMKEGVIAEWYKKVGDVIKSGDVLAEIETDKATMEFESYWDGELLYVGVKKGDTVAIDSLLAIIGKKGEDISAFISQSNKSTFDKTVENETEKEKKESNIDISSIKATLITMPKMSDTMKEGVIAEWHKKVGDKVKSGDVLAEIETDKATMEFESYWDGELLYIATEKGNSVQIDAPLAIIGEKGTNFQLLLDHHASNLSGNEMPNTEKIEDSTKPNEQTSAPSIVTTPDGNRIFISPLAKKLAEEKGINVSLIKGTGDGGRIVKKDVESYTPSQSSSKIYSATSTQIGVESFEEVQLSQMRKTIARRLGESKFQAPHFYLTMEINMDKAVEARKSINEISDVKISFNDMVIKAAATALRKHPKVNASWLGEKIRYNHHIHIGMAVAVDEGLIVPVIRFADSKGLSQIATESKNYALKAKNKELQPSDWEGNTFTISNLGMFGIEEFTAIINPPDACILAVGGIKQTPVVKNGQIQIGNVMKVTLSCDHRVVDGAIGSAFLQTFKSSLEDPVRMLI